jgi:hypothetical protein
MLLTVSPELNEYGFRFNRGIPARALMLDLAHEGARRVRGQKRLILTVGDVPANVLRVLRRRGAELRCVRDAGDALEECRRTTFDALVCVPSSGVTGLIRLLKHRDAEEDNEEEGGTIFAASGSWPPTAYLSGPQVADLRKRFEFVPIFIFKPLLPEEYAVLLRPPGGAYEEDSNRLAMDVAIMRLDARAMFSSMGPLA